MKIVWLIFTGIWLFIGYTIWGIILGLFNKELGEQLKSIAAYAMDPQSQNVELGQLGDSTMNIVLLLFGGIGFIVYGFIWGIILGLFDKELGETLKTNAMAGLALASSKFTAKA